MRYLIAAAAIALCTFPAHATGTISVVIKAPLHQPQAWQPYYDYAVPAGKNLFVAFQCASGSALNGAFYPNRYAKHGLSLRSNYWDPTETRNWVWNIVWPGGAPANSHVFFSGYCS